MKTQRLQIQYSEVGVAYWLGSRACNQRGAGLIPNQYEKSSWGVYVCVTTGTHGWDNGRGQICLMKSIEYYAHMCMCCMLTAVLCLHNTMRHTVQF